MALAKVNGSVWAAIGELLLGCVIAPLLPFAGFVQSTLHGRLAMISVVVLSYLFPGRLKMKKLACVLAVVLGLCLVSSSAQARGGFGLFGGLRGNGLLGLRSNRIVLQDRGFRDQIIIRNNRFDGFGRQRIILRNNFGGFNSRFNSQRIIIQQRPQRIILQNGFGCF